MCYLSDCASTLFYVGIFAAIIIFLVALRKRTLKLWEHQGEQQKIMMERQKESLDIQRESVQLLREIRDLLKG